MSDHEEHLGSWCDQVCKEPCPYYIYSGPSLIRTSSILLLVLCGVVVTVQLECFAESVRFIRVFECSSVYKIM